MEIRCPSCGAKIPLEDINVSTDIALCRACGRTCRFSEVADAPATGAADLNAPPSGAWFEQTPDGFRVGATLRSWIAIFYVPFTCVWAGVSLYGIYGTQIRSGHFVLFQSLFGLPFLIGSCFLISSCALYVAGRIEVTRLGDRLSVFTGVGWLGWTRNYTWTDFTSAREDTRLNKWGWTNRGRIIVLEGKSRVAFGSGLTENRSYFVLSVLRAMLKSAGSSQGPAITLPRFAR
jgi:hypothetical protein